MTVTSTARDVDLYQFTAAANSVLMAVTIQPTGGVAMDTFLRLFDSDGNPLAAENELPHVLATALRLPAAGTYYVGVSGAPNDGYERHELAAAATAGSTGDYRLDLTVTPLSDGELELSTLLAANADGAQGFVVSGIVRPEVLSEGRASISLWAISTGTPSMTSS